MIPWYVPFFMLGSVALVAGFTLTILLHWATTKPSPKQEDGDEEQDDVQQDIIISSGSLRHVAGLLYLAAIIVGLAFPFAIMLYGALAALP